MQQKKVRELLRVLIALASVAETLAAHSSTPSLEDFTPFKSFRRGADVLLFYGNDKVKQFEEAVECFWKADDEVYETIAKETVKNRLVDLVFDYCKAEEPLTDSTIEQLFCNFIKIPKEEWEAFRPLYGASLSTTMPLTLGPFTVYKWELHQSAIISNYPNAEDLLRSNHQDDLRENLIVSVRVFSRDSSRAVEFADARFRQFENVVRYMIGDKEGRSDVGIFDYRGLHRSQAIVLSKTSLATAGQLKGVLNLTPIDDSFFIDASAGNAWIWNTLNSSNPSNLQKRVLAAIEWTGKGLRDLDHSKSFVQFIFAIEALLTFKEKGILVSPSIASQLAEFTAFIVGTDFESRSWVERLVKKLYDSRSSVAHGGSQSVLQSQVLDAFGLVKSLITHMIIDPDLSAMTSMEQLQSWVNKKKYG